MIDVPVLVAAVLTVWASVLLPGSVLLRRGPQRAALVAANVPAVAALPRS